MLGGWNQVCWINYGVASTLVPVLFLLPVLVPVLEIKSNMALVLASFILVSQNKVFNQVHSPIEIMNHVIWSPSAKVGYIIHILHIPKKHAINLTLRHDTLVICSCLYYWLSSFFIQVRPDTVAHYQTNKKDYNRLSPESPFILIRFCFSCPALVADSSYTKTLG